MRKGAVMTDHRLGPKDMAVLTVLAEMYRAPMDRVAGMLENRLTNAYRQVAIWRSMRMVSAAIAVSRAKHNAAQFGFLPGCQPGRMCTLIWVL